MSGLSSIDPSLTKGKSIVESFRLRVSDGSGEIDGEKIVLALEKIFPGSTPKLLADTRTCDASAGNREGSCSAM